MSLSCQDLYVALHEIKVGRIYDEAVDASGLRVLVDRLWPRGLTRQCARLDEWCKDVAPSRALREWYGHEPDKFAEFVQRYRGELAEDVQAMAVAHLRQLLTERNLTLLTATKNITVSGASALADLLRAVTRPSGEVADSDPRSSTT